MPDFVRDFATDLFLRDGAEIDGRTICGIAVPYDKPTAIPERDRQMLGGAKFETFGRGSFAAACRDAQRVTVANRHDDFLRGADPIGRATLLRDDAAGLYAELRISRTRAGDDALELARDGIYTGLSIMFGQVKGGHRLEGETLRYVRAHLKGVSLTNVPVHAGAKVLAIRDEPDEPVPAARPLLEQALAMRAARPSPRLS